MHAGQVVAQGFGAGQVLVDGALGFASDSGSAGSKALFMLRACGAAIGETGGRSLPTCLHSRIQRLPNFLAALGEAAALAGSQLAFLGGQLTKRKTAFIPCAGA